MRALLRLHNVCACVQMDCMRLNRVGRGANVDDDGIRSSGTLFMTKSDEEACEREGKTSTPPPATSGVGQPLSATSVLARDGESKAFTLGLSEAGPGRAHSNVSVFVEAALNCVRFMARSLAR